MFFLDSQECSALCEPQTVFLYPGEGRITLRNTIILGNLGKEEKLEKGTTLVYIPATHCLSRLTFHLQYAGYGFKVKGNGEVAILGNKDWSSFRGTKNLRDNIWYWFLIREYIGPCVYQVYGVFREVIEKTHRGVWLFRSDDKYIPICLPVGEPIV